MSLWLMLGEDDWLKGVLFICFTGKYEVDSNLFVSADIKPC